MLNKKDLCDLDNNRKCWCEKVYKKQKFLFLYWKGTCLTIWKHLNEKMNISMNESVMNIKKNIFNEKQIIYIFFRIAFQRTTNSFVYEFLKMSIIFIFKDYIFNPFHKGHHICELWFWTIFQSIALNL